MNNANQQHYFKPEVINLMICDECGGYITDAQHVRASRVRAAQQERPAWSAFRFFRAS